MEVCEHAMVEAARQTEQERKEVEKARMAKRGGGFWDEELRAARKVVRAARRGGVSRREERKDAAREFRLLYQRKLAERRAARARWWARALRSDPKAAWREVKEGCIGGAGDLKERVAEVCTGALTEVAEEARRVVSGQEAADEVGRFVARLAAQDWSREGCPFDREFERVYVAFQEWRGLIQDRKAEDPEFVQSEEDRGNPVPALCQRNFSEAEWDEAIDRAKEGKAAARDEVRNEHVKGLDAASRVRLYEGFDEVCEQGEPQGWKERAVVLLDKGSTKDPRKPEQKRGVSLLSCPGKIYRQALAGRERVVLKAAMRDTQAVKHNEGCTYNTFILTQKVGERLERGKRTFCVFIDLVKAFDTVNRRLMWARARSVGLCGKLLRALKEGYRGRRAVGKVSAGGETWYSDARKDDGIGVTQGGVDSSELFAFFIDTLDEEIRATAPGSWVGIPLVGVEAAKDEDVERLAVLKHADDTVLIAESEEDLKVLVRALERWCAKWQVAPNPDKCKVVVFEAAGCTVPCVELGGQQLEVVKELVYLGYVLQKRGTWEPHVRKRTEKGAKWDAIAVRMVGQTGGCTVSVAAEVRAATAETSTLYGSEFWGGDGGKLSARVDKHQAKVARRVLGVRRSAEAVGVLTELGWKATSVKARLRRLQLWWRIERTESRLLKKVAGQAKATRESTDRWAEQKGRQRQSSYNWWRGTEAEVEWLVAETGETREGLVAMGKGAFKTAVARAGWQAEWRSRVEVMERSPRLVRYADRLRRERLRDTKEHEGRRQWQQASYLRHIGSRRHARLLAMCRLELLPVEMEKGRWQGVPRERRCCAHCGWQSGDVEHFVAECPGLPAGVASEDGRVAWGVLDERGHGVSGRGWRAVARLVERRWVAKQGGVAEAGEEGDELSEPGDESDDESSESCGCSEHDDEDEQDDCVGGEVADDGVCGDVWAVPRRRHQVSFEVGTKVADGVVCGGVWAVRRRRRQVSFEVGTKVADGVVCGGVWEARAGDEEGGRGVARSGVGVS